MRLKGVGLVIPKGGKQNFSQFLEKKKQKKKNNRKMNMLHGVMCACELEPFLAPTS